MVLRPLPSVLYLTYAAPREKRNSLYSGMGAWRATYSARSSEVEWYTGPWLAPYNTTRYSAP